MQFSTLAMATALLAGAASALPTFEARDSPSTTYVTVLFQGANPPEAQYTRYVALGADFINPADSQQLSISTVVVPTGYTCEFLGVDKLDQVVVGNSYAQALGPPQTVVGVKCWTS